MTKACLSVPSYGKHVLKYSEVTHDFVFCQNVGWHFIIQLHDCFTNGLSGLNLLLSNDSYLL